jgi:tetratricopeptide (TPR) repeat protein
LRLAVLAAEARVCLNKGNLDELERLRQRAAESRDEMLALRVEAALAEFHVTRGSAISSTIASRALAPLVNTPLVAADDLWARGRLWRTLALAEVLILSDRPTRSNTLLDRAKADFREAGFDAEWARSTAEVECARAFAVGEDYERARDAVVESLAWLRQLDSTYVELVLAYRVLLDLAAGDVVATHAGADEIERIGTTRPGHPVARMTASYVRVITRLLGEGPTPAALQAAEDHLALIRSEALAGMAAQFVSLASVLIDAGHTEPEHRLRARRWATQAAATQPSTSRVARELTALLARLDLLEGAGNAAIEAINADLDRGRELGLHRDAAQRALRAALAARRVGMHDVAERLYLEAVSDLPPPDRRLMWENALVAQVVGTRTPKGASVRLRLLGPEVEIETGSTRRSVSPAIARLVVTLIAEGGAAPADRLIDALWPDIDTATGRGRLRVALHRLRGLLRRGANGHGDALHDPIQRRGDLVALAPHVDTDTVQFEKLATGTDEDRRASIDLYRGDVAHVQLAYDDAAAPLRRRLAMIWRETARHALDDPDLSRARVARIAAIASHGASTDPELAELLRIAEHRRR